MAVASARQYANRLQLTPDRQPCQHFTQFLQAGCYAWCPTNSVKTLKVSKHYKITVQRRHITTCLLTPGSGQFEGSDVYLDWMYHHHYHISFMPFSQHHLGEPVPEENLLTLWCKGRLTEADTPTIRLGATPSGLTTAHLHHPPFFYKPDALSATQPTVSKHWCNILGRITHTIGLLWSTWTIFLFLSHLLNMFHLQKKKCGMFCGNGRYLGVASEVQKF